MATYEQDIAMYETKENGDKVIKLPVTRVNNVEGIGRSASAAYVVGDVVYVDNNKKVALKCTTAGTTSSSELDVSSKAIGSSVTDGSVVWQVVNRIGEVQSVNGQTGDVVVGKIVDMSIDGKTITLNMSDGTTKTLTTQDTGVTPARYITAKYTSGTSWYEVYNDGWVRQGGSWLNKGTGELTITFLKPFTNTNYTMATAQGFSSGAAGWANYEPYQKTKTGFKVYHSTDTNSICDFIAEGQGA